MQPALLLRSPGNLELRRSPKLAHIVDAVVGKNWTGQEEFLRTFFRSSENR